MNACTSRRVGSAPRSLQSEQIGLLQPMVRRIACSLARRLPSQVRVEDLLGVGWVAAAEAFPRTREGMPKEELLAFLSCRVRGAMLDYLRTLDPSCREIRNAARRLSRARTSGASASTVAHREESLHDLRGRAYEVPFDELTASMNRDLNGLRLNEQAVVGKKLRAAMLRLPARHQEILFLHYREEWNQTEIAQKLGVTAARISQLHSEALATLRKAVAERPEPDARMLGAA